MTAVPRFMPMVGDSMEPTVRNGDLVAVLQVDRPDPENRHFTHADPVAWTLEHRGAILQALFYTILLANPQLKRAGRREMTDQLKDEQKLESRSDDPEDQFTVSCVACDARRNDSKTLYALVDVELLAAGMAFVICGVQVRRRIDAEEMSILLPTYQGADGTWRPSIKLPPELREPIAEAVLDLLLDEGILKTRPALILEQPPSHGG